MIKRNNKKGFTIVELVIVIAVIAILAAVLIPTFSGIVKKAQLSSDQQAVRNMNIAIVASGDLADINAVIDALAENGFNSEKALIPVSKGLKFMWYAAENSVVLVEGENTIVYPEGITYDGTSELIDLGDSLEYIDVAAKDADSLSAALTAGSQDIKLEDNLTLKTDITIPAGKKVTLDLNNKTLSTEKSGERSKYLHIEGEVTIINGTIDARGIQVDGGKLVIGKDANVVINNVDSNGGAAIWVESGEVEINGGTFTALNGEKRVSYGADGKPSYSQNPGVISNNGGKITINGGTFKSAETICYLVNNNSGDLIINGGTFEGSHGIVCAASGNITINGGKFTLNPYEDGQFDGHVVYNVGATINITAGEFGGYTSVFYAAGSGTTKVATGVIVNGTATEAEQNITK